MTLTRPPPVFIADNLGLDFLNTVAVPVDTKVEWLASGEDLLAWLEQARAAPDGVLEAFRKSAVLGELDAIAVRARALRDWFKPFVHNHMGRPIEADAVCELEPLNKMLARDDEFGQIVVRDRRDERGEEESRISRPRVAPAAALAGARITASSLGTFAGRTRLRRGLHLRESLRGAALHASLRRPNPRSRAQMVQHGRLRQPSKASCSSKSA